jgi:hypothetical protein
VGEDDTEAQKTALVLALRHESQSGTRWKCPLWVSSGHTDKSASCPLFPSKRTARNRGDRCWLSVPSPFYAGEWCPDEPAATTMCIVLATPISLNTPDRAFLVWLLPRRPRAD